jgi:hypothetical protein
MDEHAQRRRFTIATLILIPILLVIPAVWLRLWPAPAPEGRPWSDFHRGHQR